MANLTLPGLVDAHVHLREPGGTHKEDVTSGTAAALSGGVVGILDMPNNAPPVTDRQTFYRKLSIFRAKAVSDYGLFLGFDGEHVEAAVEAAPDAVGLKLYLDETFGEMTTREPARLAEVFEAWPGPGPIAVHAESPSILVALRLAERYDRRLHVCHVPHPDDLLHIEAARQRGAAITCEVTPHHLFLSDEAVARLGPYACMKPPLVSPDLVPLFWERLHLVDIIASDHAPHTRAEKGPIPYHEDTKGTKGNQGEPDPIPSSRTRGEGWGEEVYAVHDTPLPPPPVSSHRSTGGRTGRRGAPTPSPRTRGEGWGEEVYAVHDTPLSPPPVFSPRSTGERTGRRGAPTPSPRTRGEGWGEGSPPGVPGLETTLPLLLRAVDDGRLTLERMVELLHHNPLRVYGLRAPAETAVEVELGAPYRLPFEGYHTRCGWSPFVGQWALGRVVRVRLRGTTVFEDGRVLVATGFGRPLERV